MTSSSASLNFEWTQLQLKPDPLHGEPLARSSHGVSYLPDTHQLFIYGGEHVARTPLVETSKDKDGKPVVIYAWLAHLSQGRWEALTVEAADNDDTDVPTTTTTSTTIPPLRIAHAQTYCAATQSVYVFGGRAGIQMQENAMADLWAWHVTKQTWTCLETTTASTVPEPRSFHRMLCLNQTLYVFGGCGQTSGRMADLHCMNLKEGGKYEWSSLGASPLLKGRGGPNLVALHQGQHVAVVAGFCGHETNDGHVFDLTQQAWQPSLLDGLDDLRPRSVCVSASFSNNNVALIFGGEVDPSQRGHEGAGGFASDIVVLNETTGALIKTVAAPPNDATLSWPGPRGWADADASPDDNTLYLFGGLAGDDKEPIRLKDLWQLRVTKKE